MYKYRFKFNRELITMTTCADIIQRKAINYITKICMNYALDVSDKPYAYERVCTYISEMDLSPDEAIFICENITLARKVFDDVKRVHSCQIANKIFEYIEA